MATYEQQATAELPAAPARRSALHTLRSALARRTPFRRALAELLLLTNLVFVLPYLLASGIGSPWQELLGYAGMGLYVYAAYRLEAGQGSLARRVARVLAWLTLFVLINGVAGWAVIALKPQESSFLGMRLDEISLSLPTYLLSAGYIIGSLFLASRLLLAVWGLGTRRLRWRLTFSYMLIGVLTLIFVPLALLVYIAVLSLAVAPTILPPSRVAPPLAAALAPLVRDAAPGELDPLLAEIVAGTARLPLPEEADALEPLELMSGVRRLSLLRPDGSVIASAGREPFALGTPLADDPRLALLLPRAAAPGTCAEGAPAEGSLADTAICAVGAGPEALLVVESNVDSSAQVGANFGRIVTVTLLGTSLVLNLTVFVVIALVPVALGVGYLIARGLTRRIERLDSAAASLAAGDLGKRVAAESPDEIGRLGATFNTMAEQLQERERALAATAERAEHLLRTNKRLVADVSHELRNPLATLRGHLDVLADQYGQQLPPDDLRVIQGEMQRLTSLVEDLFTLARAEAQQLPLSLAPVNVADLLAGLAGTLAPLARRERQIELITRLDPATPCAHADAVRLEQVVRNLAQNALRHTPPGGIIAFELGPDEAGTVRITVADTGVGIEPEDLPHVFERFYRGDSSRARETGGAGLGLSLVHELVGAMGGAVAVESTPGRGSRFTVTLPGA